MIEDMVISSRVRIARNIKDHKMPRHLGKEESEDIENKILMVAYSEDKPIGQFKHIKISDIKNLDRTCLVESRIISKDLLKKPGISSFLSDKDNETVIMINEEDHIRIQSILSGFEIDRAFEIANKVDDLLESKINYAFDSEFGYITSCPTNIGTGIRASVMLHLPFLVLNRSMDNMINSIGQMGITIRGIHGEGSKTVGNIFQLSNQTTIGESESEIVERVRRVTKQVVEKELQVRERILKDRRIEIEDRIYRSLAILKHARIIPEDESIELLSDIRMGAEIGVLKNPKLKEIDDLIINIQPAHVQKLIRDQASEYKRDIRRADYLRDVFEI